MNLIEQLKDPKQAQAFGIYQQYYPKKEETLKNAGKENLLYHDLPEWRAKKEARFFSYSTYILKPDYQPEPEYVNLEIELEDGFYGAWRERELLPCIFTHLHCLPCLPGFHGFWGDENPKCEDDLACQYVGREIEKGKKVYARFRKGE